MGENFLAETDSADFVRFMPSIVQIHLQVFSLYI